MVIGPVRAQNDIKRYRAGGAETGLLESLTRHLAEWERECTRLLSRLGVAPVWWTGVAPVWWTPSN